MKQLEKKPGLLIGGGIVASVLASLCCVGPLLLTILGVSGAASLAKLDALRIPMIIAVIILFALASRSLLKKRNSCEPDSICADSRRWKQMVAFYWVSLFIVVGFISSPYWIAWIWG